MAASVAGERKFHRPPSRGGRLKRHERKNREVLRYASRFMIRRMKIPPVVLHV
jgi:hypothetical protein